MYTEQLAPQKAPYSTEPHQTQTDPGSIPDSNLPIVTSVALGTPVVGGGDDTAPSVDVVLQFNSLILDAITSVTVTLCSPSGSIRIARVEAGDGVPLNVLTVEIDNHDPSGEWALHEVDIVFDTEIYTTLPIEGLTLTPDELSSLMTTRFVTLDVPDQDITAPVLSGVDLPWRSFTIASDNPFSSNNKESVEISFDIDVEDPSSGLNLIEFEFDIGPGTPAVVGGEWGLFGDIPGGVIDVSTFNTRADAGTYSLTRLRVSDDQGNTLLLTTDELQELGYETVVNVAEYASLEDSSAPAVSAFEIDRHVDIGADGASLTLTFTASDSGADDTGIHSATLILRGATGSLYQLDALVTMNGAGTAGTATFSFGQTFPAGSYTVERLSLNDEAFNRASLALGDTSFTVTNPFGGDSTDNSLTGDAGDNVIAARSGDDVVVGGDGNDYVTLGSGDDVAWAGGGDQGDDTIVGGAGDDVIAGGAGNDLLIGGQNTPDDVRNLVFVSLAEQADGSDVLYGGAGDDTLYGGSPILETDASAGTVPDDYGSTAANILYAGPGNDLAYGSYGNDTIGGGAGDDTIRGGFGHDVIYGGRGDAADTGVNDVIDAGEGNDVVYASAGDDSVDGGADNDRLFGGAGADTISGSGGQDTLYGGVGDDVLSGGSGDDLFYFAPGSGADTILDYGFGSDTLSLVAFGDRFDSISAIKAASTITTIGGKTGLLFDLGDGDSLFLVGVLNVSSVAIDF